MSHSSRLPSSWARRLTCWRPGERNSIRRGRTLGSEDELRRLEEDLSALTVRRGEIEAEVKQWVELRDRCNEAVRAMRDHATGFREKRDAANLRVRELKSEVLSLRGGVDERRERLRVVEQRLGELRRGLAGDRRGLEGRLRELDWEVMTTPTREMLGREAEVTKEVRELRSQLAEYDLSEELEAEMLELREAIMADQLRLKGLREEMGQLRSESQANHERMAEVYGRLDEARLEADEAHRKVVEVRGQLKVVGEEELGLRGRVRRLRGELARGRMDRLRVEAVQRIRDKLQRGGKLSFEEFRLLSEAEKREA